MREIVLDTETTGLDPEDGHRIIEIGCVELINHLPSGRTFHCKINPQRDIPAEAVAVHGMTAEYLSQYPVFADSVANFLKFIGDSRLIIHNSAFDLAFINAELARAGHPRLPLDRALDTVGLARQRFPGAQASLDALCRRFGVDLSGRDMHGALLDSQLLARVYLELIGGQQPDLDLAAGPLPANTPAPARVDRPYRAPRPHAPTAEEHATHLGFLDRIKDPIWLR